MALDALAAHLATFTAGPDELVFTDDHGQGIRRPHIGHTWRKAAKRAGVEGRSFHDLRHSDLRCHRVSRRQAQRGERRRSEA